MSSNRITEGVGKKIVEALKMQSEAEITPIEHEAEQTLSFDNEASNNIEITEDTTTIEQPTISEDFSFDDNIEETNNDDIFASEPEIEPEPVAMAQTAINLQQTFVQPATNDLEGFEIPSNVAVLKQLITKLPAGVTKQTGALIIKQTMEALGISMRSVLQEAQQVQEGLNNSSRECQASISEYKKQISILEKQAQKYQRQYAALNDIISLFVQTNI